MNRTLQGVLWDVDRCMCYVTSTWFTLTMGTEFIVQGNGGENMNQKANTFMVRQNANKKAAGNKCSVRSPGRAFLGDRQLAVEYFLH